MRIKRYVKHGITLIGILLVLFSCQENSVEPKNNKPIIESVYYNSDNFILADTIRFFCKATDPENSKLTYNWNCLHGSFPDGNNDSTVVWQSPAEFGTFKIFVIVSDEINEVTDSISISIVNSNPVIDNIFADSDTVIAGRTTKLHCKANDPDKQDLTFNWSSLRGSFPAGNNDSTVIYQPPVEVGTYELKVTVSDGINSATESILISTKEGGIPCPDLQTVEYAGKIYNTVQIGDQCWMKENLDVGNMILSTDNQKENGIIEKYCYDDNPNNCETYGGLYQWNEAMQYTVEEGTQGICPDGWHIPTQSEMQQLKDFVNKEARKLVALGEPAYGYTPINETGFSALLSGYRYYMDGSFTMLGGSLHFWSSTEINSQNSRSMVMYAGTKGIDFNYTNLNHGFSIRCLKNE